ncbi:MAG: phytanoyl-CoA dioxygenase family protein [Candidatus Hydrogenedentes bacterium]|nr:phytanoyl-CoA dioxygenase family protein [Candidatus Hydrogenedentota bacterium]
MGFPGLSSRQVAEFHDTGYLIVERLFDEEEIDLLQQACDRDPTLVRHAISLQDGEGGTSRLTLWNQPSDDLYGMFSRCERVVNSMEQLLDDEVYHYHSKVMLKEPRTGGAWTWHQDYGYWYQNACLFPDMASAMIAVDRAARENGCLQVLKGSHKMGRVEHLRVGSQTGADPERVEQAMKLLELVYCEMAPGDTLFFHSNLLHRSDQNRSDRPRLALICCYNTKHNNPYRESHHPRYTPLVKVPDSAIKAKGLEVHAQRDFLNVKDDKTVDVNAR